MPTLSSELRSKLERVVIEARDVPEAGARASLEALAVHHHEPHPHMKPAQRELRNHLRARARQLGDRQDASGRIAINHLVDECAYEHWHRMLFARFLAENGLLIEPQENMAISLAEAEELAREEGAVTQLFTEPYMVEFLLHNTLGAWWAGKRLTAEDAENAETEEGNIRNVLTF